MLTHALSEPAFDDKSNIFSRSSHAGLLRWPGRGRRDVRDIPRGANDGGAGDCSSSATARPMPRLTEVAMMTGAGISVHLAKCDGYLASTQRPRRRPGQSRRRSTARHTPVIRNITFPAHSATDSCDSSSPRISGSSPVSPAGRVDHHHAIMRLYLTVWAWDPLGRRAGRGSRS